MADVVITGDCWREIPMHLPLSAEDVAFLTSLPKSELLSYFGVLAHLVNDDADLPQPDVILEGKQATL